MPKITFIIITIFLLCLPLHAQSYEGFVGRGTVWVDLTTSKTDSSVTGSYFYKKSGAEIKLAGTKAGDTIYLVETVDGQKITGYFNCTDFGDSITGMWGKDKDNYSIKVRLYKTSPAYKEYAKDPKADELFLADSTTLGNELDDFAGEGYNTKGKRPGFEIVFDKKNILSVKFSWSYMSAYPTEGINYHTFNLATKKEIALWSEIDESLKSDFNKYLCQRIQPELTNGRKSYADSEWVNAFGPGDEDSVKEVSVDKYFVVTDVSKWSTYYIDDKYLHFIIHGYFDFPHAIEVMDLSFDVPIPFADLDKYLNTESILKRLTSNK
jgi:hypothetical protein